MTMEPYDFMMEMVQELEVEWEAATLLHAYMAARAAAQGMAHTHAVKCYWKVLHDHPNKKFFGVTVAWEHPIRLASDDYNPEFFKTYTTKH